jgi:hypothetical protein
VTDAGERPAILVGWSEALGRGFAPFLVMAGIGQLLAFALWLSGATRLSIGTIARLGWMEFGAFHHVAIELEIPDLDVAAGAGRGATSLSVGVALLTITAIAIWLLGHAGRAVADRFGGGVAARAMHGAKVAPAYALPSFALASIVEVRTPLRFGTFATGELRVSLSPWQALVLPLAIAAAAGAAGGLRSAMRARSRGRPAIRRTSAVLAGGTRMFAFGLLLSYAGLFLAGIAQPDGPAALLTPSTAHYFSTVFDRPGLGLVAIGHHLAIVPNEAVWALVPAMGGCVGVRGSVETDLLCYGRFPVAVESVDQPVSGGESLPIPIGGATFETAPAGYFLFLLVPAISTLLGGRLAARRLGVRGWPAAGAGATGGVVFAALVGVAAALSSLTVGYGAAFGEGSRAGWVAIGPGVVVGALLALAWGVVGGAIGGASLSLVRSKGC